MVFHFDCDSGELKQTLVVSTASSSNLNMFWFFLPYRWIWFGTKLMEWDLVAFVKTGKITCISG